MDNNQYTHETFVPDEVRALLQANGFEEFNEVIGGCRQYIKRDECITFGNSGMTVMMRWDADDDRGEHWTTEFAIDMYLPWWTLQWSLEKYQWLFDIAGVIPLPQPQPTILKSANA